LFFTLVSSGDGDVGDVGDLVDILSSSLIISEKSLGLSILTVTIPGFSFAKILVTLSAVMPTKLIPSTSKI